MFTLAVSRIIPVSRRAMEATNYKCQAESCISHKISDFQWNMGYRSPAEYISPRIARAEF